MPVMCDTAGSSSPGEAAEVAAAAADRAGCSDADVAKAAGLAAGAAVESGGGSAEDAVTAVIECSLAYGATEDCATEAAAAFMTQRAARSAPGAAVAETVEPLEADPPASGTTCTPDVTIATNAPPPCLSAAHPRASSLPPRASPASPSSPVTPSSPSSPWTPASPTSPGSPWSPALETSTPRARIAQAVSLDKVLVLQQRIEEAERVMTGMMETTAEPAAGTLTMLEDMATEASAALRSVTKKSIQQVRHLKRPPQSVVRSLELVYMVFEFANGTLDVDRTEVDWKDCYKMVANKGFVAAILDLDLAQCCVRRTPDWRSGVELLIAKLRSQPRYLSDGSIATVVNAIARSPKVASVKSTSSASTSASTSAPAAASAAASASAPAATTITSARSTSNSPISLPAPGAAVETGGVAETVVGADKTVSAETAEGADASSPSQVVASLRPTVIGEVAAETADGQLGKTGAAAGTRARRRWKKAVGLTRAMVRFKSSGASRAQRRGDEDNGNGNGGDNDGGGGNGVGGDGGGDGADRAARNPPLSSLKDKSLNLSPVDTKKAARPPVAIPRRRSMSSPKVSEVEHEPLTMQAVARASPPCAMLLRWVVIQLRWAELLLHVGEPFLVVALGRWVDKAEATLAQMKAEKEDRSRTHARSMSGDPNSMGPLSQNASSKHLCGEGGGGGSGSGGSGADTGGNMTGAQETGVEDGGGRRGDVDAAT